MISKYQVSSTYKNHHVIMYSRQRGIATEVFPHFGWDRGGAKYLHNTLKFSWELMLLQTFSPANIRYCNFCCVSMQRVNSGKKSRQSLALATSLL